MIRTFTHFHKYFISSVLILSSLSGCAARNFDATLESDWSVIGREEGDRIAQRAVCGDLNGDGFDDIVFTSRYVDLETRFRAGAVFVFFGRDDPVPMGMVFLDQGEQADLVILGASAEDRLGFSDESPLPPIQIFDMDGDNLNDLLIGAPNSSMPGRAQAGRLFVIKGRTDWPPVWDLASRPADIEITGASPHIHFGSAFAAGDFDGDGAFDLAAGSPLTLLDNWPHPYGRIDVISGNRLLSATEPVPVIDLASQPAEWTILGASPQEELGDCMVAGDTNGDGFDDLFIGALGGNKEGFDNCGRAYLFFGDSAALESRTIDLRKERADCTIYGKDRQDRLGHTVNMLDLFPETDGRDLVIGTPYASPEAEDSEEDPRRNWGAVYIFQRRSEFPPRIDLALESADVTIHGPTNFAGIGYHVEGARIFSRNRDDLVVGSFRHWRIEDLVMEGMAAIYPTTNPPLEVGETIYLKIPDRAARIWGGEKLLFLTLALSTGDIDRDDLDDVIVGSPKPGMDKGKGYVFYGEHLRSPSRNPIYWISF